MTKYAVIHEDWVKKNAAVAIMYNTKAKAVAVARSQSNIIRDGMAATEVYVVIDFGMGKMVGRYKDGKVVK